MSDATASDVSGSPVLAGMGTSKRAHQVDMLAAITGKFLQHLNRPVDLDAIRARAKEQEEQVFVNAGACEDEDENGPVAPRKYQEEMAKIYQHMRAAISATPLGQPAAIPAGPATQPDEPRQSVPAPKFSVSPEEAAQFWAKLQTMRHHGQTAHQYIGTMNESIEKVQKEIGESADNEQRAKLVKRREYYQVIIKWCRWFANACGQTESTSTLTPKLKLLTDIDRLLDAILPEQSGKQDPRVPSDKRTPTTTEDKERKEKERQERKEKKEQEKQKRREKKLVPPPPPPPPPLEQLPPEVVRRNEWRARVDALTWNDQKTRNKEQKYSYGFEAKQEPSIKCDVCSQWFYETDLARGLLPPDYVSWQKNYAFTCKQCNDESKGGAPHSRHMITSHAASHPQRLYNVTVRTVFGCEAQVKRSSGSSDARIGLMPSPQR